MAEATERIPKVLKAVLAGGVFMVSLLFFRGFNDAVFLPVWLVFALLTFIFAGLLMARKNWTFPAEGRIPMMFLGLFLAGILLSFATAISPAEALMFLLRMGVLVSWMGLMILAGLKWKDSFRYVVLGISLAIFLQSLIGVLQVFGVDFGSIPGTTGGATGTQTNKNLLGSLLFLGLPFLAYAGLDVPKKYRWVVGLVALLVLPVIWWTESRTALLGIVFWAILMIPMALFYFRNNGKKMLKPGITIGLGLLIAAACFGVLYKGWGRKMMPASYGYLVKSKPVIRPEMSSAEVRMVLWNRTVKMGVDHLATGVGAGNWKLGIPEYGVKGFGPDGRYGGNVFLRAHNDHLQVFAETGLLGLVGWLGFWGFTILIGVRRFRRADTARERLRTGVMLLGLTGFLLVGFFSFPLERPAHALYGFSFAAWILADRKGEMRKFHPGTFVMFGAVSLGLIILFGLQMRADGTILKIREAKDRQDWPLILKLESEMGTCISCLDPQAATPVAWYEGMAYLQQQQPEKGLAAMEKAHVQAPWSLAVRSNYAAVLYMVGREEAAMEEYRGLLEVFPDYDEGWMNLAACQFRLEDVDGARNSLKKIHPNFRHPNLESLRFLLGN